ncbi:hypothetical protein GGR50DRAFT_336026 [Xylaria sp. CBS 124048]|nr:hypothetical protein GGR50DRAFT_336026 [Xylaria sp. CBS 124048]
MAATTAASSTSSVVLVPWRSPVADQDASQSKERNATPPLPTKEAGDTATKSTKVVGEGVDQDSTLQSHVASPASESTATPVRWSTSKRSLPSPQAKSPSSRSSATKPSPTRLSATQPLAISTGSDIKSRSLRTPEIQQNPQDSSSSVASRGVPSSSQASGAREGFQEASAVKKRFPSPGVNHNVPGFKRDLSLVADVIQRASPEAVREAVREKWQKCSMGSEFHEAFLMNAMLHHTNGAVLRRAIRDFGRTMVKEARDEVASHLKQADIDAIAATILEKCSDEFLDKALAKRLGTIDGRSLINALARAGRLGYDQSDVLEEDDKERVVPVPVAQMRSPPLAMPSLISTEAQWPLDALTGPHGEVTETQPAGHPSCITTDLKCKLCCREFKHTRPYEYHVQKQLCTKVYSGTVRDRKFMCDECGACFTTKISQQYHFMNAVCGREATPKSSAVRRSSGARRSSSTQKFSAATTSKPRHNTSLKGDPTSSHNGPNSQPNSSQRSQFTEELQLIKTSYAAQVKETVKMDSAQGKPKLNSLQDTFDTKRGLLMGKYDMEHPSARIEPEGLQKVLKHGLASSPSTASEMPSAKRLKSDYRGPLSAMDTVLQAHGSTPPMSHLAVSQMGSGLSASTATAATSDPTLSTFSSRQASAENHSSEKSLTSSQQKGYKASSHLAGPRARARPTLGKSVQQGSASEPVLLSDSSDETVTDEDIPAVLPYKKTV